MIKLLKPADYVTLLNATSGVLSICFTLQGNYTYAICLILAAIVFDFLDGKVARAFGSSKIGHDLDSLADTISFGVAPAVFLMGLVEGQLAIVAAVLLTLCGILRLARFNVLPVKNGYEGIPIPLPSIAFAIYYFAGAPLEYLPYLYIVGAGLMILIIKIKKII